VSKKKGMLSWLGLGKQEDQKSIENSVSEEQHTSQDTTDAVDTVSVVTSNNIAPAKTIEEQVDPIERATKGTTQLSPDIDVTSLVDNRVAIVVEEVSDTIKQTDQITETDERSKNRQTETKLGFFARLKQGLSKTSENLSGGLVDLFRGKQIDDELFEELETHLLLADVGVETTMKIIASLTQSASRKQLKDASTLHDLLKIELKKVIEPVNQPLTIESDEGPFVMLMVGVNGVGKTTTIGKLAKQFQAQGKSVMLAAGDTFRAAAVEQLQVWGERNNIPVIAQHTGADSASVIFDAINAAKARHVDVIIADTAGRLQNKAHLMEELKKVVRVMKKLDVKAPHEVMLTLDAGTGQNALSQTKLFDEAVGLTGLTITKFDGTAKGGVIFAIADKYNIPIRYLGVGEGIDDLRPFHGDDFIDALFNH
jgi:fused signal recognition particle receptor